MNIKEVYVNFWGKPKPEYTEMEMALMEGGHCLEEPKVHLDFIKSLTLVKDNLKSVD